MAASFDLVSEPWIPCVRLDGTSDELGLLDTLTQAHELREVVDASPLVTASLHRLLLAIVHRNFGPHNYDAWRELWEAGRFDAQVLTEYFDQWRHRFDLFDEERPFYQTPGMLGATYHPLAVFAEELASGINKTLFSHDIDSEPVEFSPARAAALVIAMQNYDLSGTRSHPEGSGRTYPSAAPLGLGFAFMSVGDTLLQTLLLNLVAWDPVANDHIQANPADIPSWERDEAPWVGERMPDGYVDYLTWQARCLHLRAEDAERGHISVKWAIRAGGEDFASPLGEVDPMVAYVRNDKATSSDVPYSPFKGSVGRTLWRDSMVLLRDIEGQSHRPSVLDHVARAAQYVGLARPALLRLWALGLVRGRQAAKVEYWRHERLPLPLRYLADDELVEHLRACLELTESVHGSLYGAGCALAEQALTAGVRDPDGGAVSNMIDSLGVSTHYWSALELPFRELVVDLAAKDADRDALEVAWVARLRRTAWQVFERAQNSLAPNARNLRAISHARRVLGGSLKKKLADYEEVTAHAD
ncbi:MAG: type I-E CRISPR-associated protein Cse1/CasA [Armatimonadota bacterium]|jgi:CRISPR system Cascade subunit CasA